MASSYDQERRILLDEAVKAAERHGVELIINCDNQVITLSMEYGAFMIRFFKRKHAGPPRLHEIARLYIDHEAVLAARHNPDAARDLFKLELDRAMLKHLEDIR